MWRPKNINPHLLPKLLRSRRKKGKIKDGQARKEHLRIAKRDTLAKEESSERKRQKMSEEIQK